MATSSGPGRRTGRGRRSRAPAQIVGCPQRRRHLMLLTGLLALVIAFFGSSAAFGQACRALAS